jgi:hypothetical protein
MATYPAGLKTYTNKTDGVDLVLAADVNSLQDEVEAIEAELGVNPSSTALPSAGQYYPNGNGSTVADRLTNLEAGLTAGSTDGYHVGYTLLHSGNFTSAPGALSVPGTAFTKFVVVIRVTTPGSLAGVTLNANGATTLKYGFFNYANAVPTVGGGSTSTGPFPIDNSTNPLANHTITAELYNVNGGGGKTITWINGFGFGNGIALAGGTITAAITTITLAASAYATTATYSIYGVK